MVPEAAVIAIIRVDVPIAILSKPVAPVLVGPAFKPMEMHSVPFVSAVLPIAICELFPSNALELGPTHIFELPPAIHIPA